MYKMVLREFAKCMCECPLLPELLLNPGFVSPDCLRY